MGRRWPALQGHPSLLPTPAARGCGVSSSHPAQPLLWVSAPAKPPSLLPGVLQPRGHTHTPSSPLLSWATSNTRPRHSSKSQLALVPTLPEPFCWVLPPPAGIQSQALPKTKSRTGTFHIFLVDWSSLGPVQLVSVPGED